MDIEEIRRHLERDADLPEGAIRRTLDQQARTRGQALELHRVGGLAYGEIHGKSGVATEDPYQSLDIRMLGAERKFARDLEVHGGWDRAAARTALLWLYIRLIEEIDFRPPWSSP